MSQFESVNDYISFMKAHPNMTKDGIILRHQFNEIPPHVEYSLTEKGRTLSNVLLAIADWGMEN